MHAEPTRPRTWARLLACAAVAWGLGLAADARGQQPPAAKPADDYATRPVAYIHGNVPVTRAEFGEFLMARGGVDKLELFVNKKIIEHECARRGVAVTEKELLAALDEDLKGISVKKDDFVKVVLPRYGKSLYEWMEDVIKPRLLLSKLCRDRVQVADEDVAKQFEREYGEKRRVQIIMWPKGDDLKAIEKEYAKIRTSQEEFDRAARGMANPSLAASAGHIKPICRHTYAEDKRVEDVAFQLQVGQVSEIIGTSQGYVVLKLHEVLPKDDKVKLEDVRERLRRQAFDELMTQEIPKYFAELKKAAAPNFIFTGPELWRVVAGPDAVGESKLQGVTGTTPAEKK